MENIDLSQATFDHLFDSSKPNRLSGTDVVVDQSDVNQPINHQPHCTEVPPMVKDSSQMSPLVSDTMGHQDVTSQDLHSSSQPTRPNSTNDVHLCPTPTERLSPLVGSEPTRLSASSADHPTESAILSRSQLNQPSESARLFPSPVDRPKEPTRLSPNPTDQPIEPARMSLSSGEQASETARLSPSTAADRPARHLYKKTSPSSQLTLYIPRWESK